MNIEKRSARFGAAILIFSILLRLTGALIAPTAQAEDFSPHRPVGGVSLGTGTVQTTVTPTVPTLPVEPVVPTEPAIPPGILFSAEDMDYISFRYATDCGYRTELEPLLTQPLDWRLDSGMPTVLIVPRT